LRNNDLRIMNSESTDINQGNTEVQNFIR